MSPAVESAAAPARLDVGDLERKLIGLRTEIDAILTQLASSGAPAAASPGPATSATAAPAEAVPADAPAREDAPAEPGPAAGSEEAVCGLDPATRADATGESEGAEPTLAAEPAMGTATLAPTVEQTVEPTGGPTGELAGGETDATCEPVTHGDLALLSSTDADPAPHAAADATATEEPRGDAEPTLDAAVPAAVAAAIDPIAPPAPAGDPALAADAAADAAAKPPAAAAAATTPADEALLAAPTAAVIDFEPRRRKQKADARAPRPVAASRGRRVAGRVAAGIVALIAAAGALVVADRGVLGGAHALPWMSPLPSYEMPWSFFGQQKRAEGAAATAIGSAQAGEALLARYHEVWPMSP